MFFLTFGMGLLGAGLGVALYAAVRRGTARTSPELFQRVQRAKREWEAVFDTLDEMILVSDMDGFVTRVNGACARALKAHPRELVGKSLSQLFAGHPEAWLQQERYAEIEDARFNTVFEVTRVALGQQQILVARDVGNHRRLTAQLMQSDKMATVGVLAAGVAHEINNPSAYVMANLRELGRYLQNYRGAVQELRANNRKLTGDEAVSLEIIERFELPCVEEEGATVIAECIEGMERIRSIVGTLQSISRRDPPGQKRRVPLEEVMAAVAKTAGPHLRSWGGDLKFVQKGSCAVEGFRGQLIQVALNLVVNAIQAKDVHRPNHIVLELTCEGESAVLRVSDTGKGIPPAVQEQLFQPFFTTKPEGLGTGLGLAISREIVLAHGGTIDLSSTLGKGTTFTVRFPVSRDEELEAPPVPAPVKDKRLRLLIIDDEPNLLKALERQLSRLHEVEVAVDGDSALRALTSSDYDVVLCDINMPGMDGFELQRRVARMNEKQGRRFLFFTGQPMSEVLLHRLSSQGLEAIQKPLDVADLNLRLIAHEARALQSSPASVPGVA